MKFLDDWKVSAKILAALLIVSTAFAICAVYSSMELSSLAAQYRVLTDQRAPAAAELIRANRRLNQMGYAAYKAIAYDGASAEGKAAKQDFDDSAEAIERNFATYAELQPTRTAEVEAFKAKAEAVVAEAGKAVDLGLVNDNEAAKAIMRRVDPNIKELNDALKAYNDNSSAADAKLSAHLAKDAKSIVTMNIVLALAGIVGGMGAGIWISKAKIANPLNQLAGRMARLAEGDLQVDVDGQDRKDEVGTMAKAVQVFKDNAVRARELAVEADRLRHETEAERARNEAEQRRVEAEQAMIVQTLAANLGLLAEGDLTARIDEDFKGQYLQIKTDFNSAVGSLQEAMNAISAATGAIRGGSNEIATASDDLSKRTEQQAASLEETAAALDEITATVKRSAEGAKQASAAASSAKTDAERSGAVVGDAVAAMGEIEQSSEQITQIIGVIDEIAFQTNLLALNAGVEAARAGDAGRGFAVVAQEVRALAQRSAEAAKEIKALIASSSSQVQRGVKLVGDTGQALTEIVVKVAQIDNLISEIAKSSHEQATGLNEVNVAVNQMDQVTQQNAAMVEEATAASVSLNNEAGELGRLVGRFRTGSTGAVRSRPEIAQPGRHAPARNPVAQAQRKLASFTRPSGGAAPAPAVTSDTDNWEEF